MTQAEIEELVLSMGEKKYHGKTIFSFIQDRGINEIDELTTVSKAARNSLKEAGYFISGIKTVEIFSDPDGTQKYLFELGDGARIETVSLNDERGRRTLCISTQVGCRMNCQFCATAHLHFKRQLSAGEITSQVIEAERQGGSRISNVVYMGMGEPLDNYENVMKSIYILNDAAGKNIGARHITISTSGIISGINRLAEESLQVRLAVSLHAPNDHIRQKIMHIAKRYPLDELMKAVRNYQEKTGRRVTFEYVLIKDINDSETDARALVKLLGRIKCNINLIEYNPHELCDFLPSERKRIERFQRILQASGIENTMRFKRGRSIKAACGQLGASWYTSQVEQ